MQRNLEIQNNAQKLAEGFEQAVEDFRSTSLYLRQKDLDFLDSFKNGSRSENLRRILDFYKKMQDREDEEIL